MDDTSTSVAPVLEILPVRVELAGAANMRDLGGYPTRSGARVRSGLLYRSDSPHRIAGEDIAAFERLGVRTFVDLRSHDELGRLGRPPLDGTLRAYLHVPLRRSTAGTELTRTELTRTELTGTELTGTGLTLDLLYRQFVTHSGDELRAILRILSDEQALPALFYCVAGKDRTGIVAAIILGLLEVPDEAIAADYAATADTFDRFLELAAQDGDPLELTGGHRVDPALLSADAATILAFLGWIRAEFGSVGNLVTGLGIDPAVIASLQRNLVENLQDWSGTGMRIVQISDTHLSHLGGVTNDNFEKLAAFVNDVLRPDLIVNTGDAAILSPDSGEDRATAHRLHSGFLAPVRVVPGNHDVGEPGAAPWTGISVTSERVARFRETFGSDRWVEVYPEWAVIGINSELMSSGLPEEAEQWEWLSTLPDVVQQRRALIFMHKPVWSPIDRETEHSISLPAAERDRLLEVLKPITLSAVCSGHLHRYEAKPHGDVMTVSAPSTAFVAGSLGLPGLHQLGVVELRCEDGRVRPLFRSVPTLVESEPWHQPEFVTAWNEIGAGPLPGSQ
jgi:protein tyrosine/serine phosphatase/predicted phosphodiesterase